MKKLCAIIIFTFLFVAAPAYADVAGEQHTFSVDPKYDSRGRSQVIATLRATSQKAYFYVADDYWDSLSPTSRNNLQDLIIGMGNEFDNRIYPVETAFFGSEPNPGIDNDPRITMLLTALRYNVGGYFDSADAYSKEQIPASNQREMLYLNTSQIADTARIYPFIAHEFQHLISFNQKELLRHVSDDVWLNELRSEYATTLLGYNAKYSNSNFERRVNSFFQQPSDSLTEWPNDLTDYGQIAMLGEYVAEHWSPKVIADTLLAPSTGIASFNFALANNGFPQNFENVFSLWAAANYLNDTSINPFFGYTLPAISSFRADSTRLVSGIGDTSLLTFAISLKDWEQRWYDIQDIDVGTKPLLLVQASSPGGLSDFRIPYAVINIDGTTSYGIASFFPGVSEFTIPDLGTKVRRVILMPFKKSKISGFGANEQFATLQLTIQRSDVKEVFVSPEQFGLHEGDFIRAEGDKDIYIINQYGYKRIVLSPQICLQYGHLGARGCFGAVHMVTSEVRDAFKTSPYYTNGETHDGKIYQLIETGEDSAYLQLVNHVLDNSVFFINAREQKTYTS